MTKTRTDIINELKELFEVPLLKPELYYSLGIHPSRAILLYGVTGVGKTYLIKKITKNANVELLSIEISGISDIELLEKARHAASKKSCVIYLVLHNPEAIKKSVISMLCKILDGVTDINLDRIVFAGSAVRPSLPPELRRPGRFDREIEISLPEVDDRLDILRRLTAKTKLENGTDLKEIAKLARGFTPADLESAIRFAARFAIRQKLTAFDIEDQIEDANTNAIELGQIHLLEGINATDPTVFREFGIESPNVSMNQLGGLKDIKERINKEVIMPLIHPDYFSKVG